MIAAGLCLMGGCFAQDSSAQAVETYWPAHSLHMQQGDVYTFSGLAGVRHPFWSENMRAGAIAENVAWTVSEPSYIFLYGTWNGSVQDAAYFGPGVAGLLNAGYSPGSAVIGILSIDGRETRVYSVVESASPVARIQADFKGNEVTVSTENASQTKAMGGYSSYSIGFNIKFQSADCECDMRIYWWRNDEAQQRFFMVQPLKTPAGNSAFFIHGHDILTEI